MVDVLRLPEGAFGYVPTPALVAPLEFMMSRQDFLALGGHEDAIQSLEQMMQHGGEYCVSAKVENWPEDGL